MERGVQHRQLTGIGTVRVTMSDNEWQWVTYEALVSARGWETADNEGLWQLLPLKLILFILGLDSMIWSQLYKTEEASARVEQRQRELSFSMLLGGPSAPGASQSVVHNLYYSILYYYSVISSCWDLTVAVHNLLPNTCNSATTTSPHLSEHIAMCCSILLLNVPSLCNYSGVQF